MARCTRLMPSIDVGYLVDLIRDKACDRTDAISLITSYADAVASAADVEATREAGERALAVFDRVASGLTLVAAGEPLT